VPAHEGRSSFEYFHGDNGAGLGANHQTGWTGVVARLMQFFATVRPEQVLETGAWSAVRANTLTMSRESAAG
jgi:hypothetical protein